MGLYDFTFYDLIRRNAGSFSERICWHEVDDGREISFAAYKQQVDRLAGGLKRVGITKGDRIGVLGKNSFEFFLLYGAAAALGAIILPINWRLSAEEICFNLNDCVPKIAFVDHEFQTLLDDRKQDVPSIGARYNLKADQGDYTAFASLQADEPPSADSRFKPAEVTNEDGFVIIHTAAVAGRPRGALLSHGNVMTANLHLDRCFALTARDVHFSLLPLFHVGGLFMATSAFQAGVMNLNVSKFDAGQAVELIRTHNVSLFFDFPPILASILDAAQKSDGDIGSLRAVMGLGTPDDIARFQNTTGGTYHCLYGQTETSCLATTAAYNEKPGSAGRAIPLADIRLVDDHDQPVAVGEVGEIAVKGPMVFKGYWNLPEDNAYTFRGGWHHTGDLGRFDADGFLFYAGRKPEKELIKPGGENVYPAEVEQVILKHPAVRQTVVIGVPDPKWKEGIKAVCELEAGQSLTTQELIDFVGERIARYKKPQYVEFVNSLPQQADGNPDREQVKAQFGGDQQ